MGIVNLMYKKTVTCFCVQRTKNDSSHLNLFAGKHTNRLYITFSELFKGTVIR